MQVAQDRTPAVAEVDVRVSYYRDGLGKEGMTGLREEFELRDVTLRFSSNRPYSVEDIATIFMPVDLPVTIMLS